MNVAIIVAAGTGSRMGDGERKQFRLLAGKPLVVHTLKRFEECHTIGEMIAVVPAGDVAQCLRLASEHNLGKLTRVVPGGNSRAESVLRGLQAVRAATAEIIAVHDGARPFVSPDEIDRTVRAAQENVARRSLSVPPLIRLKRSKRVTSSERFHARACDTP